MKRLLATLIIGLCLFSSCKDNEWDESAPQTFKLISVQFTPTEEPMEEIFGELNATTFENQSDKEKPFVLTRKECRKKTSFFHAPKNEFLLNGNIQEIFTSVPEIDAEPKIIGLSVLQYPLTFDKMQTKTDSIGSSSVIIQVPANSSIVYTTQLVGYKIKATYHLTLKNEMTSEEVVLIGKWEGIQEVGFRDFIEEKPDGQFGKRNPINCSYRHFSLS